MDSIQKQRKNEAAKSYRVSHRILLGLCVFVAAGALGGGGMAVVQPSGALMSAQALIPVLHEIPLVGQYINSLLIPGLVLLVFVFIPHLIAVILLFKTHTKQYFASIICGALLIAVTTGEVILLGSNFLSWLYCAFGAIEIILSFSILLTRHS